jgi:hypothetical protein
MNLTSWLFLYLAGLVQLAIRYRLSFGKDFAAVIVLLPLLAVLLPRPQRRDLRAAGTLVALLCSALFVRSVLLDYWDTQRLDCALLAAGTGLGSLFAVDDERHGHGGSIASWLLVSLGWGLALWTPAAPWLALGPAAMLSLWGGAPRSPGAAEQGAAGVSPAWLLFWIGLALPKPWWDSDDWGVLGTALWALGVAATHLPVARDLRPRFPLLSLAMIPLLYPWVPLWIWAPLLGVASGYGLQASRPAWPRAAPFALLGGLVLSYALHSNLQWFGWLVWGPG